MGISTSWTKYMHKKRVPFSQKWFFFLRTTSIRKFLISNWLKEKQLVNFQFTTISPISKLVLCKS